jgi:hypothetical protein
VAQSSRNPPPAISLISKTLVCKSREASPHSFMFQYPPSHLNTRTLPVSSCLRLFPVVAFCGFLWPFVASCGLLWPFEAFCGIESCVESVPCCPNLSAAVPNCPILSDFVPTSIQAVSKDSSTQCQEPRRLNCESSSHYVESRNLRCGNALSNLREK